MKNSIENVEKISKRFLIASFVCGICSTISICALICGFYWSWITPDFWAIFTTTFLTSFFGVIYFGTLENFKKEKRNKRLHDENLMKMEHEYQMKELEQNIKIKELELETLKYKNVKEVK